MCSHSHSCSCKEHNKEKFFPWVNIIFPALMLSAAMLFDLPFYVSLLLYIFAYLWAGYDVLFTALKNILKGDFFDENFLMSVATIGAILIKEYPEAVAVMLLYKIGEALQDKAVDKSKNSISKLMDINPQYANVFDGVKTVKKNPDEVNIDDIIVVKTGEKIPLDGVVVEGKANIDTSALTGESMPLALEEGKEALSGCIVKDGYLKIKVLKLYHDSTISKILELVEHASDKKTNSEKFITKFARIYTPIVVFLALFLAVFPPVVLGDDFAVWINRALVFLVISCPCALVISVPLSFFAGIGSAARKGILIKGSKYIEVLSKTKNVVFDKTGTLTKGHFSVEKVASFDGSISEEEILENICKVESCSNHPLALSILSACDFKDLKSELKNVNEISGKGIKATVDNEEVLVGNLNLLKENNIDVPFVDEIGSVIYLAKNSKCLGYVVLFDTLKDTTKTGVENLKKLNINTYILSGDSNNAVKKIADELGVVNYYSKLLPQDKVEKLENIIKNEAKNQSTVFVGDGINDAPVLKRADIGISMGVFGSDIAIEASDVVIMDDNLTKISKAIYISKRIMAIAKQNIAFAIFIKVLFLLLSTFGLMTMWGAIFADVGVTFLAVLNSLRAMR